jgi:cytidylate kinase
VTTPSVPLIAIDGPAASGKGTLAQAVATELEFHYLESGALYRLVALKAIAECVRLDDESALASLAARLDVAFADGVILLEGADVTDAIRAETMGALASKVAVFPQVRTALLGRQRAFLQPPGLVAEGRDMGTVVFPEAPLKIYVTASAEARAARRYKQLIDKGNSVILDGLLRDIRERDERDSARSAAPLRIAADAVVLDTTHLSIAESVAFVLQRYRATNAGPTV